MHCSLQRSLKLRAQHVCSLHITPYRVTHSSLPLAWREHKTVAMDVQDFPFSQQQTSPIILPCKPPNPPQQVDTNMAPDQNANHGSYTSMAMDCKHAVYHSVPSALSAQLSRPADTYSEPLDWEDEYEPSDFVSISANILLCNDCEEVMRAELRDAAEAYSLIWTDGGNNAGPPTEESKAASDRYVQASIKVANFEARMADRENGIAHSQAKKANAAKKVKFAVEEGEGAGEKPKQKKEKLPAIALGWVEVDHPAPPPAQQDETQYVFAHRPKPL